MKLADKPCYPTEVPGGFFVPRGALSKEDAEEWNKAVDDGKIFFDAKTFNTGLTFKERLVIALASNPAMFTESPETIAENIDYQADAIIAELERQK